MHICRKTYGEWILFQHSSAVASTLFLLSGRSFQLFLLLIPTNTFQIVKNMYIFNYFQLKRNKLVGLIFVGAPALWPLLGPMFPIVPVSGGASWGVCQKDSHYVRFYLHVPTQKYSKVSIFSPVIVNRNLFIWVDWLIGSLAKKTHFVRFYLCVPA